MRLVLGIVVGLMLGLAMSAAAGSMRWYSGAQVLTKSSEFQSGYVAGVYDGFTNARDLVAYGIELNADTETNLKELDKYLACMNRNSDTLGQFKDWAVSQWTSYKSNDKYSGAAVMLSVECTQR